MSNLTLRYVHITSENVTLTPEKQETLENASKSEIENSIARLLGDGKIAASRALDYYRTVLKQKNYDLP